MVPLECLTSDSTIQIMPETLNHVFNGSEVGEVFPITDDELRDITMNRVSPKNPFACNEKC